MKGVTVGERFYPYLGPVMEKEKEDKAEVKVDENDKIEEDEKENEEEMITKETKSEEENLRLEVKENKKLRENAKSETVKKIEKTEKSEKTEKDEDMVEESNKEGNEVKENEEKDEDEMYEELSDLNVSLGRGRKIGKAKRALRSPVGPEAKKIRPIKKGIKGDKIKTKTVKKVSKEKKWFEEIGKELREIKERLIRIEKNQGRERAERVGKEKRKEEERRDKRIEEEIKRIREQDEKELELRKEEERKEQEKIKARYNAKFPSRDIRERKKEEENENEKEEGKEKGKEGLKEGRNPNSWAEVTSKNSKRRQERETRRYEEGRREEGRNQERRRNKGDLEERKNPAYELAMRCIGIRPITEKDFEEMEAEEVEEGDEEGALQEKGSKLLRRNLRTKLKMSFEEIRSLKIKKIFKSKGVVKNDIMYVEMENEKEVQKVRSNTKNMRAANEEEGSEGTIINYIPRSLFKGIMSCKEERG